MQVKYRFTQHCLALLSIAQHCLALLSIAQHSLALLKFQSISQYLIALLFGLNFQLKPLIANSGKCRRDKISPFSYKQRNTNCAAFETEQPVQSCYFITTAKPFVIREEFFFPVFLAAPLIQEKSHPYFSLDWEQLIPESGKCQNPKSIQSIRSKHMRSASTV